NKTVRDYSQQLLAKAENHGAADKADELPPEITHDHVRASAHTMAATFGARRSPSWLVLTQVVEYIAAATAGVGAGHLDQQLGIIAFAIGTSLAVILIAVRLAQGKGE